MARDVYKLQTCSTDSRCIHLCQSDGVSDLGNSLEELVVLFFVHIVGAAQPDGLVVIQQLPAPLGLLLRLWCSLFFLILSLICNNSVCRFCCLKRAIASLSLAQTLLPPPQPHLR